MTEGHSTHEVTEVLARWSEGDREAALELLPLVYDELRRLARSHMRRERGSHTLQPTALVHEAYLRLADRLPDSWDNRSHFFALSARVMRQVLVDHARRSAAEKRGGDRLQVTLGELSSIEVPRGEDMLALDEALDRLRELDPRKVDIVELRFFGGLNIDETAELLGVSTPTIVNETRKARAWLFDAMSAR